MGDETVVAFGKIFLLFLRRRRRGRQQREKTVLGGKCGCVQSFNKRLEEHKTSTKTTSESLVWAIENIFSGKRD